MQKLKVGDEINATLRAKLITIKEEFQDWAWQLLNTRTLDERVRVLNDSVVLQHDTVPLLNSTLSFKTTASNENENDPTQKARASIRVKFPNKKYASDIFEKNDFLKNI